MLGEPRLLRRRFALCEAARHADDFKALVLEVVSLFGVQRENPIGQGLIGGNQYRNLFQSEHFRSREAVPAIRSPELATLPEHDDQWVQKRARGLDRNGQSFGMGGGQIALERRRFDGRERKRRQ
jgi:hypothetical protein